MSVGDLDPNILPY